MKKNLFKVLIIGNSGVGKTSMLGQYIDDMFSERYKPTIGADFLIKETVINSAKITLQLWDTAGQEKYRSLCVSFYRGSDACILVYDITDKVSFDELDKWMDIFLTQIPECKSKDFPFLLIGNKLDIADRKVDKEAAQKWCKNHGNIPYFETSAKTKAGINDAFDNIAKTLYIKGEKEYIKNNFIERRI